MVWFLVILLGLTKATTVTPIGYATTALSCSWACTNPVCAAECRPICAAPQCEYQCTAPDTCQFEPSCRIECPPFDPVAPQEQCPVCETICNPAPTQCGNCSALCTNISCDWQCRRPNPCPAPVCELQCESPACAYVASTAAFLSKGPPLLVIGLSLFFVVVFF